MPVRRNHDVAVIVGKNIQQGKRVFLPFQQIIISIPL
jgi:hypothetical protein